MIRGCSRVNTTGGPDHGSADPVGHKKQGDKSLKKGDSSSAIGHYLEALKLDFDYIDAWESLATALSAEGREEEAQECRNKAGKIRQSAVHKQKKAVQTKNPVFAAVLSILPGLGLVYTGQPGKGLLVLAAASLLLPVFFPAALLAWIAGIWYSFSTARKINEGTVPFRDVRISHVAGYLLAAVILILVMAAMPSFLGLADAETLVRSGTGKISDLPARPGLSDIPRLESAKEDYRLALTKLKKVPGSAGQNMTRADSLIIIATYGITTCNVDIAGIRAYDHHMRMNSFLQNYDFDSAKNEAVLAKAEYGTIAALGENASAGIATVDMDAVPSDLWQTIAQMKNNFDSVRKYRDYIPLMEAYEHYCTSVQYNRKAGTFTEDWKNPDFESSHQYMEFQTAELRQVITISEPLQMSAVPEVAEAARKLVQVSRMQLK
jgi:tetratricopeptide (TPR) repeat protein